MTTGEWGIFNDEAEDWTANNAVEADFYSRAEAEKALTKYDPESECIVHECEEEEEEEEE